MRILLAQNAPYYPSHGGGDKSNRLLLEALAERGHICQVVARHGYESSEEYRRELAARGVRADSSQPGAIIFERNKVGVHVVSGPGALRDYFVARIASFEPAVILCSTDDPAQLLLESALAAESARVVFLARATLALFFGPDCAFPSPEKTRLLKRADAVVGVSHYVANYIRQWSGIEAVHAPISPMEPGPYPYLGGFDNEFVTFVNPCAVKGISIFLALAARMPHVRFAAVPTWGTTAADRAAMGGHPNIHILDPVDDIDRLLARTRALLVPSLWPEARSRIVVEAMLRGVPVLASDTGGIPEAKLGIDYLLPVKPIRKYALRLDERMMPAAEVPDQDIEPWFGALDQVLTDREHFESLSHASRAAALEWAGGLSVGPFEDLLEAAAQRPKRPATQEPRLSPEKSKLLEVRLRKRNQASAAPDPSWFPFIGTPPTNGLRLFCFPHAGGGALAFRGWKENLPPRIEPCPVRLPGRESRSTEPVILRMPELAAALADAIVPYLGSPFAFFGHSMGAAVAFELARCLRRRGHPLPAGLFVSSARAPQFRLNHVPAPEPTELELLAELRGLEGTPAEVTENPELARAILPALRTDTALYRGYVYQDEPPLDCEIRAYGGADDVNVRAEHLEPWRDQTLRSFRLHLIPGGHFYMRSSKAAFFEALSQDVQELLNQAPEPPILRNLRRIS